MLKRSLRPRSLSDKFVNEYDVTQYIDGLLSGKYTCEDVPGKYAKSVISNLTKMRKDCILQRRDQLSNKIDEILGELCKGPAKYPYDVAENPNEIRTRTIKIAGNPKRKQLNETGISLVNGAPVNTVDIPTRLALTPVLKMRRSLEVSRMNYTQSKSIDTTLDNCAEYVIDSKRVGPRLLKIQELKYKA